MRILHLFNDYLPQTMNWAYNLIVNTPDAHLFVGAVHFHKTNFYSPEVTFVEFPLRDIEFQSDKLVTRFLNRGIGKARQSLYPSYLKGSIGAVDMVHSHFATAGWKFREFPKKFSAPHVVSFYGYDYEKVPSMQPVWLKRYQQLFKAADAFLCEGTHGAELLARQGLPPDKVRICRLGVSPERIPTFRRTKRAGDLRMLQVATLTEKKGHIYALRAFFAACAQCPNMELVLVGSARDAESEGIQKVIEQEIAKSGFGNRVKLLPSVRYDQLYNFFSNYHLFIHPSLYASDKDSEGGAPIVLLDAQATGMPVIATDHCDIPDEVIHGQTGLLAPERNVETLAAHIRRFYEMGQDEYDGFAAAARKHVENNYDIRQNAAGLRRIYDEVLSSR